MMIGNHAMSQRHKLPPVLSASCQAGVTRLLNLKFGELHDSNDVYP